MHHEPGKIFVLIQTVGFRLYLSPIFQPRSFSPEFSDQVFWTQLTIQADFSAKSCQVFARSYRQVSIVQVSIVIDIRLLDNFYRTLFSVDPDPLTIL